MQTLTQFEELFADRLNVSLRPEKSLAYDFDNAMFHLPTKWTKSVQLNADKIPGDDELRDDAISLIQGEYKNPSGRGDLKGLPRIEMGTHSRIEDVVWKYLKVCESSIYSGAYDHVISARDKSEGERIRLILSDQQLGKKRNAKFLSSEFDAAVTDRISRKEPIQIVLPSFPFKDQNPFRNDLPAHSIDLSEVAMLIRLHAIALALYQIYAFGVQWVIVCDGMVYSQLFGVQAAEAAGYREELRRWRNRLNLQQTIQIIDFEDIISKLVKPENNNSTFWKRCDDLSKRLKDMTGTGDEDVLRKAVLTLKRGMKWNLNSKEYLAKESIPVEQLWHILNGEDEMLSPSNTVQSVAAEVDYRAEAAAFGYLAFNLKMGRYSNGLAQTLPRALRATVHPKPGQIAAPGCSGDVYPWNGRCLVTEENSMTMDSLQCKPLFQIAQEGHSEVICRGRDVHKGCFYLVPKSHET
ncbi:MAG: L-tyrosine/L-tryptophan isonitrile synthase family protein [Gallionellaceae bacterium]